MRSTTAALLTAVVLAATGAYYWLSGPSLRSIAGKVTELNASLPTMVDAGTRLEEVTLGDTDIVYRYTLVDISTYSIRGEDLARILEPKVRAAVCDATMTRTLLDNDYTVYHRYHGKDRRLITEIGIKRDHCD